MENGFERAIKFIIEHETVYAKHHYGDLNYAVSENDPDDDGGLTKFGIDQRSHPDEDIENLTYERAVEIYREEYWNKSHANELPFPLSLVQVDGAVNTGVGQQNKFLQRVCGIHDDGIYGPYTRKESIDMCKFDGAKTVALKVIEERRKFYVHLAEAKPKNKKYLEGWLNRIDDLKKEVETA